MIMYDEFNTYSKPLNREYKTYSMDLCGRTLSVDIGRVAAQANGAVLCSPRITETTLP